MESESNQQPNDTTQHQVDTNNDLTAQAGPDSPQETPVETANVLETKSSRSSSGSSSSSSSSDDEKQDKSLDADSTWTTTAEVHKESTPNEDHLDSTPQNLEKGNNLTNGIEQNEIPSQAHTIGNDQSLQDQVDEANSNQNEHGQTLGNNGTNQSSDSLQPQLSTKSDENTSSSKMNEQQPMESDSPSSPNEMSTIVEIEGENSEEPRLQPQPQANIASVGDDQPLQPKVKHAKIVPNISIMNEYGQQTDSIIIDSRKNHEDGDSIELTKLDEIKAADDVAVKVSKVSFSYNKKQDILTNISLNVPRGMLIDC